MTDEPAPVTDKPAAKGIDLDANGDPVLQGTRLIEKESYERIIDGMKIAAEAAVHLSLHESKGKWRVIALKLDQCRRICAQHAGMSLVMKEQQTSEVRGDPMNWRHARDRFRYGLQQASGGMRQLATCFRMDLWWSRMATSLENMEAAIRNPKRGPAKLPSGLILPPGYH